MFGPPQRFWSIFISLLICKIMLKLSYIKTKIPEENKWRGKWNCTEKKEKLKIAQYFNYVLMHLQGLFRKWKIYITESKIWGTFPIQKIGIKIVFVHALIVSYHQLECSLGARTIWIGQFPHKVLKIGFAESVSCWTLEPHHFLIPTWLNVKLFSPFQRILCLTMNLSYFLF